MSRVKVAVRVRPASAREDQTRILDVQDTQITVTDLSKSLSRTFTFDHCFTSDDPSQPSYADQTRIFNEFAPEMIADLFGGYNVCLIAYGQTGSGKTYTLSGTDAEPGLLPQVCEALMKRFAEAGVKAKLEASYVEIYNENVFDLLIPPTPGSAKLKSKEAERQKLLANKLKIREDQHLGPYVEGKTTVAIKDLKALRDVLARGNIMRHVSATEMSEHSSRSHAVFTLVLRQMVMLNGKKATKVSAFNFVDLGGTGQGDGNASKQERLAVNKADPVRVAEGAAINRSLTTLGMVITALGKQSKDPSGTTHVPYRDAALTWLLKGALGGNSKTFLVATLSPSAEHYEETISTLRYADRAKHIINKAVINSLARKPSRPGAKDEDEGEEDEGDYGEAEESPAPAPAPAKPASPDPATLEAERQRAEEEAAAERRRAEEKERLRREQEEEDARLREAIRATEELRRQQQEEEARLRESIERLRREQEEARRLKEEEERRRKEEEEARERLRAEEAAAAQRRRSELEEEERRRRAAEAEAAEEEARRRAEEEAEAADAEEERALLAAIAEAEARLRREEEEMRREAEAEARRKLKEAEEERVRVLLYEEEQRRKEEERRRKEEAERVAREEAERLRKEEAERRLREQEERMRQEADEERRRTLEKELRLQRLKEERQRKMDAERRKREEEEERRREEQRQREEEDERRRREIEERVRQEFEERRRQADEAERRRREEEHRRAREELDLMRNATGEARRQLQLRALGETKERKIEDPGKHLDTDMVVGRTGTFSLTTPLRKRDESDLPQWCRDNISVWARRDLGAGEAGVDAAGNAKPEEKKGMADLVMSLHGNKLARVFGKIKAGEGREPAEGSGSNSGSVTASPSKTAEAAPAAETSPTKVPNPFGAFAWGGAASAAPEEKAKPGPTSTASPATTSTSPSKASEEVDEDLAAQIEALQAEIDSLRSVLGPDELAMMQAELDALRGTANDESEDETKAEAEAEAAEPQTQEDIDAEMAAIEAELAALQASS